MRARIFPMIVGLVIATGFIFTKSIIVAHLMYLIAALILYKELTDIYHPQHRSAAIAPYLPSLTPRDHATTSLIGMVAILAYTTLQVITLLPYTIIPPAQGETALLAPPPLVDSAIGTLTALSPIELNSMYFMIIAVLFAAVLNYLFIIFATPSSTHPTHSTKDQLQASIDQVDQPPHPAVPRFLAFLQSLHALLFVLFFLYSIVKIKLAYLFIPNILTTPQASTSALLFIWIAVWIYDTAAYIGGTKFPQSLTRHKMGISVSTQKSWAGLIFGTCVTSLFCVFAYSYAVISPATQPTPISAISLPLFSARWIDILVLSCLFPLAAQLGDLIASMLKRAALTKDSGKIFGSHGGFLDRNDSAFFTFACSYYLLLILST